jgi:hypothetical protein
MTQSIRSPLSADECKNRLSGSVEGRIGSMKLTAPGWHVLGEAATASIFKATVIGMAVGPDGKRMLASRPSLSAELAPTDSGTLITYEIAPRFGSRRKALVARYVLPPILVIEVLLMLADPSERTLAIGAIVLSVLMLVGATVSRRHLGWSEDASQSYLLGWLRHVVEARPDE